MPDKLEIAPSGRARCRGCGKAIEKGAVRFGEVLPRPSGDDDATSVFWFHPRCAAHRRPEKFAQLLHPAPAGQGAGAAPPEPGGEPVAEPAELPVLPDRASLLAEAEQGLAFPRLARIGGAERASSGRARCRHCKEAIAADSWRIRLATFADTGFPEPLGFLHAGCAQAYFADVTGIPAPAGAVLARVGQASPDLAAADVAQIEQAIAEAATAPANQPPNPSD